MRFQMRAFPVVLALLLSKSAVASTWVVDGNGGPGVDFTQIQPAIDAAVSGDTLLVMPGTYTGFTLDKGLRIFAAPPGFVLFSGSIDVHDVPAGRSAMLTDLTQNVFIVPSLTIRHCPGAVVCEGVSTTGGALIEDCVDVRLRKQANLTGTPVYVRTSRVELTESELSGGTGANLSCQTFGQASPGNPAVEVESGEIHVARCQLTGGTGGSATCFDPSICGADGGEGGSGLFLHSGAVALLTGLSSHVVRGGFPGFSDCGNFLSPAPSVRMQSGAQLRYSGASIPSFDNQGGTIVLATPADPTLNLLETPHPGTNLTFRVVAQAGANAKVRIGRRPDLVIVPGLDEDILTIPLRTFDLGTVPASGVVGLNLPLSGAFPAGTTFFAQAVVTPTNGSVQRSNSVPILVR